MVLPISTVMYWCRERNATQSNKGQVFIGMWRNNQQRLSGNEKGKEKDLIRIIEKITDRLLGAIKIREIEQKSL